MFKCVVSFPDTLLFISIYTYFAMDWSLLHCFNYQVWNHPEADKLYCEEINIGEEKPRQITSGLREHYSLEDMQDRKVLVVCNLKSSKIVGFVSEGMVLAAKVSKSEMLLWWLFLLFIDCIINHSSTLDTLLECRRQTSWARFTTCRCRSRRTGIHWWTEWTAIVFGSGEKEKDMGSRGWGFKDWWRRGSYLEW